MTQLLFALCLALALGACVRLPVSTASLDGTEWTLQVAETPKGALAPETDAPPLLRFEGDQVAGSDGCNQFSGTAQMTDEGSIAVGPLASTKRACPPPFAALSEVLLSALAERTVRAEQSDGILRLTSGDTVLVYGRR